MKMKKNIFLIVLIAIILTSCDCVFDYTFKAKNLTSSEIEFRYKKGDRNESLSLMPNEEKEIFVSDGFRCGCRDCQGSRINSVDSTINFIMTDITVIKNDSISKTNFNYEYNWEFESKKKLGVYTAKITDSNF